MRHNKKFNHLGRTHSHRAAMLANMAISLIMRVYVEPLITKSKEDTTASRRVVFSYLQNKYAITELFGEIAKAVAERPGGYTRIIKLGRRASDDAEMAFIELVDFDENMAKAEVKKTRTRRSRKSGAKAEAPAEAAEATATEATEAEATEAPAETPAE